MPVSIVKHQGKDIVFTDYTHCKTPEETIRVVNEAEKFLLSYPGKALVLVDVTGARGSKEYMERAKEVSKRVSHKVEKRAVVGITGLKMILFQGYTRIIKGNTRPFNSREEALAFLVA